MIGRMISGTLIWIRTVVALPFKALRRTLRKRHLAFAALPVLLVLNSMRGGGPVPLSPAEPVRTDTLQIALPETVPVATAWQVQVAGFDEGDDLTILVDTGYQLRQYELLADDPESSTAAGSVQNGIATILIPAIDGPGSGIVTVTAAAGDRTAHGQLQMVASTAIDPLEILLGPRTIEVGGDSSTMVVVLPIDEFGNPVEDGTPVDLRITRPDLLVDEGTVETAGMMAWTRVASRTAAGISRVAVEVGDAGGKEFDFTETAGTPVDIEVFAIDPTPLADGRSTMRVRTGPITDEFGNALPDGIDVFADMAGSTGVRRFKTATVKGAVEFNIEAPSMPGPATLVVTAAGARSEVLELNFEPAVVEFDLDVLTDLDGISIEVGPVRTVLGGYIPEGTPIIVTSEHGIDRSGTRDGVGDLVLLPTNEPITIEVLGLERTIQLDG